MTDAIEKIKNIQSTLYPGTDPIETTKPMTLTGYTEHIVDTLRHFPIYVRVRILANAIRICANEQRDAINSLTKGG